MGIFPRAPATMVAGNIAVVNWEYSQTKEFLPQAKEFQIFPGYSLIIANFFSSNKRVPFQRYYHGNIPKIPWQYHGNIPNLQLLHHLTFSNISGRRMARPR